MKRLLVFSLIAVAIITTAVIYLKFFNQQAVFKAMGIEVKIFIKDRYARNNIRAAANRIREIEKALSKYDKNSEVSRLNRGETFEMSQDLSRCLSLSEKAKKATYGTFNVYYNGKVDLDGIGKGFAAEEARQLLYKRGVKNAMIDMRSSIAVLGGPWKIGIVNPQKKNEILEVIELNGPEALSTSGDYEQGSHIIDPSTGKPASLVKGVTIVGNDAGFLDALSTGIFVMGPKAGLELAKELNLKALIIGADGKIYRHNL
ncbi:MAG: thiamine biosynthesis lipoprotein [Candidatus Saganbacteria bacterium]|uniref:FAD:protein FMN transferase n=1 Tax=Candidatus Saganbacteria bacterium TaxID=2575572 RepID=A0A833KZI0_UNCSA|nr:MAG: thiamine biosynthesis lipoprotein [Candidatus Saganbacteria bacterium]